MAASLDVISFLKASLCISATSQTLQVRCLRAKSSIQCPSRVTTASSDVVPSLEALPLEPLFGGGLCLQRGDWPGRTASCNTGLPMRELLLSGATSSGSCRRRSPILPTFSSARSCSPFSVVGVEGACLRGSSLFFQLRPVSAACQGFSNGFSRISRTLYRFFGPVFHINGPTFSSNRIAEIDRLRPQNKNYCSSNGVAGT